MHIKDSCLISLIFKITKIEKDFLYKDRIFIKVLAPEQFVQLAGVSFDGGIHYNFEAMKSYNYLIGICILSCPFYNAKILNPITVFYILCIATMIFNKDYFFTLEPYARITIALCVYASFFHFVAFPLGRKVFK